MKKFLCNGKKGFCHDNDNCANCEFCDNSGGEYKEVQLTNADRIRAMSDEELASFLSEFKDCGGGCLVGKGVPDCSGLCATADTLGIWLQQPLEED